jgi:hypothetical protein
MKKRSTKIIGVVVILALIVAYICRASYLGSYSRLYHESEFEESIYAGWIGSTSVPRLDFSQWARIRLDFWFIAMSVKLDKPRQAGNRILVHAKATDRTDTEYIYVFDHDWHFIKIFSIPRA